MEPKKRNSISLQVLLENEESTATPPQGTPPSTGFTPHNNRARLEKKVQIMAKVNSTKMNSSMISRPSELRTKAASSIFFTDIASPMNFHGDDDITVLPTEHQMSTLFAPSSMPLTTGSSTKSLHAPSPCKLMDDFSEVKYLAKNFHLDPKDRLLGGFGSFSAEVSKKYFGAASRIEFSKQYKKIYQQRNIVHAHLYQSTPADIVSALDISNSDSSSVTDLPFRPARPPVPVKMETKVIIRRQTLELGDAYSEMKLIQRPHDLHFDDDKTHQQMSAAFDSTFATTLQTPAKQATTVNSMNSFLATTPQFGDLEAAIEAATAAAALDTSHSSSSAAMLILNQHGDPSNSPNIKKSAEKKFNDKRRSSKTGISSSLSPKSAAAKSKAHLPPLLHQVLSPGLHDGSEPKSSRSVNSSNNNSARGSARGTPTPPRQHHTSNTHAAHEVQHANDHHGQSNSHGHSSSHPHHLPTLNHNDHHGHHQQHSSQHHHNNSSHHGHNSPHKGILKQRRLSIATGGLVPAAQPHEKEFSMSQLAELYTIHSLHSPDENDQQAKLKESEAAKNSYKLDSKVEFHPHEPMMELICVDYRDPFNKKVAAQLAKQNSLFRYVEGKTLKRDFHDANDSGGSDAEDEIKILDREKPKIKLSKRQLKKQELEQRRVDSAIRKLDFSCDQDDDHTTDAMESQQLKLQQQQQRAEEESTTTVTGKLSPRSMFIDNCIRERINPRASLILRKSFTKELNMKHMGMGNDIACLLAEALVGIPFIEALNVCDNNLTDRGLSAIVNAISAMKELIKLDLSFNEIGPEAAESLRKYLSNPECPLQRLELEKADVDDDECRDFVSALHTNKHLIELNLNENKVGSSEDLNTVMPDLVTGGEALAELLRSDTCPLKVLTLSWNLLRLGGAAELCSSIAQNASLTVLDLSYNSLGQAGGIALGSALQENKTLKTLLIANNSLDSVALLVICAGILENTMLHKVVFDGNPIGENGAKALMLLPTIVGSRVKVSAKNCNLSIKDPNNWFDTSALVRTYDLDLSNHFDRAVAIILTYLVPAHQTYIIAQGEYFDSEKKQWIDLLMKETIDKESYKQKPMDPEQQRVIDGLLLIKQATKDIKKAVALFQEVDKDGSGELDEEEFSQLMQAIGMDISHGKVQEIMAEYDVDGGGVIEMAEFLLFLKNQQKDANKRLRELTEVPVLISKLENPSFTEARSPTTAPATFVEELHAAASAAVPTPMKRYLPPNKGKLKLQVIDGFQQKESYRVITPGDRSNILQVAEQSGEVSIMANFGMKNYKIRLAEALTIVYRLLKENSNKVQVLANVLPQMATPADAKALVFKVLGYNLVEITRLKREVGASYRVIMGQPDGFYSVDLSSEMDRFCVNRLLEISMTTAHLRSTKRNVLGYGRLGDTSQKGNFSCFRNETYNHKAINLSVGFASPLPKVGKLEFDFVSQRRFKIDNFALTDVRFTNLLVKTFQMTASERPRALQMLDRSRQLTNRTLQGDARTIYEIPKDLAFEISDYQGAFYSKLHERTEQLDRYRAKENVKASWEYDPNVLHLTQADFNTIYIIPSLITVTKKNSFDKSGLNLKDANKSGIKLDAKKDTPRLTKANTMTASQATTAVAAAAASEQQQQTTADMTSATHDSDDDSSDNNVDDWEDDAIDMIAEKAGLGRSNSTSSQPHTARKDSAFDSSDNNVSTILRHVDSERKAAAAAASAATKHRNSNSAAPPSISGGGSHPSAPLQRSSTVAPLNATLQPDSESSDDDEGKIPVKVSPPLSELWNRYVCLMGSRNVPIQAKAAKTLELLVEAFETQFMYARHLEMLVLLFSELGSMRTSDDFGTYRVDLVTLLFNCVIDLHNFEIVMRRLSSYEAACVYCRIGILNIFNPMKPEGSIELDLSRRDERVVAKMLCQLSVVEPGDNFPFQQFRWERAMDPTPAFIVTEPWMTEDGMPNHGFFASTYYAGEGKGKKGCKPATKFRRALLNLVLIEEEEIISELDRENEVVIQPLGPAFIAASNPSMWLGYLSYSESYAREKKGKGGGDGKKGDAKNKKK